MDFSDALIAAKHGARIRRSGWNGKGIWVCYGKGQIVPAANFWNEHTRNFAMYQKDQQAEVLPYLIMRTADEKILMGWLASQTDLLAEDWEVLSGSVAP